MGEKNELVEGVSSLPDVEWTKELKLVKEITAKNCSDTEFKLLCYTSQLYGLNPLKKEIWAVKYEGKPALIFVSRDGLLNIAHRVKDKKGVPVFDGMETTFEFAQPDPKASFTIKTDIVKPISATCTVYRKDCSKAFKSTVYFDEYKQPHGVWLTKPKMMLQKCAEVTALRRAFNLSGFYCPEEMPEPDNDKPNGKVIDVKKEE